MISWLPLLALSEITYSLYFLTLTQVRMKLSIYPRQFFALTAILLPPPQVLTCFSSSSFCLFSSSSSSYFWMCVCLCVRCVCLHKCACMSVSLCVCTNTYGVCVFVCGVCMHAHVCMRVFVLLESVYVQKRTSSVFMSSPLHSFETSSLTELEKVSANAYLPRLTSEQVPFL